MNNNPENLLHPLILKWLNRQGWTSLHDIQKQSIEPILEGKNDIIISAATLLKTGKCRPYIKSLLCNDADTYF